MYGFACLAVFLFTYCLSLTYVTVFYHRGLAHGAVVLKPWFARFVVKSGPWLTGIDPVAWSCMHRLHHKYSDTAQDPHSPVSSGPWRILLVQLKSYKKVLAYLIAKNPRYLELIRDIPFSVGALHRSRLWTMPYVIHGLVALCIAVLGHMPLLGAAYFVGLMSHPIQGWMVNSLGHLIGTRNFDLDDHSRNNLFAVIFAMGEGYQNNHHMYPASAKFSYTPNEFDMGYGMCLILEQCRILTISRQTLIPSPK